MAEVRKYDTSAKSKLAEAFGKRSVGAGSRDEHVSELIRSSAGDRRAQLYSCLADDAAMSASKREASMMLSAAEGLLQSGEITQCLKVARNARTKFDSLGSQGADGYADALHIIIDAHRLEAYLNYAEPEEGVKLAKEELAKFQTAKNKRGQAKMHLALAEIASDDPRLGKRQEALEPVTEALKLAQDLGDKQLEARCLVESAFVNFALNNPDKMLENGDAALSISEELGDNLGKGMALYAIAVSHMRMCARETAVQKATLAQRLFESLDKKWLEAGVLHSMAIWHLLDEKPQKAVTLAERALTICQQESGRRAEAVVTFTLCEALQEAKNAKGALKVAKEALEKFQDGFCKKEQAMMQEALAAAHLASAAPEKAAATLQAARSLAQELSEKRYESRLLLATAAVQLREGEYMEAMRALQDAAEIARDENDLTQLARAQRDQAAVLLLEARDMEEALGAAESALDTAQQDNDKLGQARATLLTAICYNMQEDVPKALSAAGNAQALFKAVSFPEGEAQTLLLIAELKAQDEKLEEAREAAEGRLDIFRQLNDIKMEAKALMLVASLHLSNKLHEEAERCCEDAIGLAKQAESQQTEVEVMLLLVQVVIVQVLEVRDQSTKALAAKASKIAGDTVLMATRLGEKGTRGVALYWKAQCQILEQKYQDAQRTVGEAEALFRNIQNEQGQAACMQLTGVLHAVFGQPDKALDALEKALAFAQAAKDSGLEYEISTSIFNIQRQSAPKQQMMMQANMPQAQQQMMMDGGMAEALAESVAAGPPAPKGLDPAFVRKQLMTFVKDVIASDDELEIDSPFMEAGLDSLSSVSLMSMVAKEFQMALSPSLVFDFPTVRALEDHLVEESKMV